MQHLGTEDEMEQALLDLVASLPPEKRLAGLSPTERVAGLSPTELLASLSPEAIEVLRRHLSEKAPPSTPPKDAR